MTEKPLQLPVAVGQFPIALDIPQNVRQIQRLLQDAQPGELVALPEGAISGYADDLSFLAHLDKEQLAHVLDTVAESVVERQVHLIIGSCLWDEGAWWNAGIYFAPDGQRSIYRKVNLAMHERGYLTAGSELPVFSLRFERGPIKVGIQLCREIRFPEQWRYLAAQNIDMFVFLTNAISPAAHPNLWRSHLISRAAENQRFVLSANMAHACQHCPTMMIAPSGETLSEAAPEQTTLLHATLDLGQNANVYLNQCRTDVITLKYNQ